MDENPGLSEQYRMASPWPVFVALGVPISELGILFGVAALSVGGLVLFGGSVAGMLREAGYVATPWRALTGIAAVCFGLGTAFLLGLDLPARGYAVIGAGIILLVGGLVGELIAPDRDGITS